MCLCNIVLPIIIDIEIHNVYFRALYCLAVMRLNSWHMCVCVVHNILDIEKIMCGRFQGTVLPGSHAIERYLIEEQIDRIIHTNYIERKDWWVSVHVCVKREFGQWVCVCVCTFVYAGMNLPLCFMYVKRLLSSKRGTESVCAQICVCVRCVVGWLVCVYLFDITLVIFLPHQMDFHTEKNPFVFLFDLVASKNSVAVSVICWSKICNRNWS